MRRFLILLVMIPLFVTRAWADEPSEATMELFEAGQMESGLSDEERAISGSIGIRSYDAASALSRLYRTFTEKLKAELRASLDFAVKLLALVFLCSFSCSLCAEERIRRLVEICGVCAAAALLLGKMNGLISQTTEAVYRLSDYSRAALPVVYTAAAASGGMTSAPIGYAAACLALEVMISLVQKLVIPLVYALLSLTLTNTVFPHPLLESVEKLTKWAAKTSLTTLTFAFTAYLGMSTLISRNVDAAAVKAARTVISGALPVVGGLLSDASAAVLSAAAVVRSCTGAFGLVAVCAICAGPFAVLSVKCFLLKLVSAVSESAQSPQLEKLFSGVGGAVGMLMGVLGCCAVMLFLSFAAAMKVVSV